MKIKEMFLKKNWSMLFILIIKMASSLGLNISITSFKSFNYNGSINYKLGSTFESSFLLKSFKSRLQTLSQTKCILLGLKNNFTLAISYEVNEDSTILCKSYSSSNFKSDSFEKSTTKSKIYLKSHYCEYKYFFNDFQILIDLRCKLDN